MSERAAAPPSGLAWPPPTDPAEAALFAAWEAKVKRHHGRTSKPGFAPVWAFQPKVAAWVERQLTDLAGLAPGPVVHVCSGSSLLGDVRVDLTQPADVRATAFQLPIKDGGAGTVVCDPPWAMPYHLRRRLNLELARICRPGGLLIWVAPWMPDPVFIVDHEESCISIKESGWPSDPLLLLRALRV